MSTTIVISGQSIEFPTSGTPESWAEAVDQFAEAVEIALQGVSGPFDVSPQVMNIDAYNTPSAGADIPNLAFSTTSVRAVEIKIATYRTTLTVANTVTESVTLMCVYNGFNNPGALWEIARDGVGDGHIDFIMSDAGQLSFTIVDAVAGSAYTGILSYSARALLNA